MDILQALSDGDRRSIGRSEQVVEHVLNHASQFDILIDGLSVDDALVRMRCADVAEKVSSRHPEWLQPFKDKLIEIGVRSTQREVRLRTTDNRARARLPPSAIRSRRLPSVPV